MNAKPMTRLPVTSLIVLSAIAAAPAMASHESGYTSYQSADYDYATVTNVEPLVRQVRINVPQQECYSETRYVPVNGSRYGNGYNVGQSTAGRMILGGLVGAVIGHQIGNSESRHTGAIAGAIIGSAIGNEVAMRRNGQTYGNAYSRDELRAVDSERCETRNEQRIEERIEGYRVTYRYNNRSYTTQMSHDPGAQIRVRVNVNPAG
jgi:uncharacterized protein YcfJ